MSITAEELAQAEQYSVNNWIEETIPEFIRPRGGYMISKYCLENHTSYIKWLESKIKATTEYAFTLTTDITDPEQFKSVEEQMIFATSKILAQQTCPVLEAEAYLEYQASGAPHIHGWYKCNKGHRIYQKIFKRYWPLWDESKKRGKGHQGGYHCIMKTNQYRDYQAAEGRKIFPVSEIV